MKHITNQRLFDNAALGIIGQGTKPCIGEDLLHGDSQVCQVMSDDGGSRCALGWSVKDAKPGDQTTPQWDKLTTRNIAELLRRAHDETLLEKGPAQWRKHMSNIALEYKLDDSYVYFKLIPKKVKK